MEYAHMADELTDADLDLMAWATGWQAIGAAVAVVAALAVWLCVFW
jgi:hypothetical protein